MDILCSKADGILTIGFNRPERKNAITGAMYQSMADALTEAEHDSVREGRGGGGAHARVEEAELAEHLPGPEHAEQALAAVVRRLAELHLAVDDDVHRVARLALGEQHLALRDVGLGERGPQRRSALGVEGGEQRGLHEGVVHGHSPAPDPGSHRDV